MKKIVKLAEKLGAEAAEVFFSSSWDLSFSTRKDEIYSKEFDSKQGYGIRIVKDGRIGFSYFIDVADAEKAIKTALSLSRFSEKSKFTFQTKQRYGESNVLDKKISSISEEEVREHLMGILEGIKKEANPTEVFLSFGMEEVEITNSYGLNAAERSTGVNCYAEAAYGESVAQTGYGAIFLEEDFEEKCAEVGKIARSMNSAKKVETSRKIVVFDQQVVHSLLMLLIPSFNGERIRRKASVLNEKVGELIAHEKFSLIDDPGTDAVAKSSFDGEGTAADRKLLIEKGFLRNFLFDRKTIAIMGEHSAIDNHDGNCVRGGYTSQPMPGHSNLVVEKGEIVDLTSEVKEGIYLKSFFGEHTANDLTGDFSVSVDTAFNIKNGEVSEPVRNFVISGNIFRILKQIWGIEKKQERYFDILSPKIAFEDVQVVG